MIDLLTHMENIMNFDQRPLPTRGERTKKNKGKRPPKRY